LIAGWRAHLSIKTAQANCALTTCGYLAVSELTNHYAAGDSEPGAAFASEQEQSRLALVVTVASHGPDHCKVSKDISGSQAHWRSPAAC